MKRNSFAFPPEVRKLSIFEGLDTSVLQRLLIGHQIVIQHHGEELFTHGQNAGFFGYILDGAYKLNLPDSDGEEIIFHFGTQGEPLAIMSVMERATIFPFHATSLGTSRFLKIPKATFQQEWARHPQVMLRFQTDLQGRIFRAHEEKRLLRMALAQKVAGLFLFLTDYKSTASDRISFPLTRKDIASYVGASVESIIRLLSDWSTKKIISSEKRVIRLCQREALLAILNTEKRKNEALEQSQYMLEKLWAKTRSGSRKPST